MGLLALDSAIHNVFIPLTLRCLNYNYFVFLLVIRMYNYDSLNTLKLLSSLKLIIGKCIYLPLDRLSMLPERKSRKNGIRFLLFSYEAISAQPCNDRTVFNIDWGI